MCRFQRSTSTPERQLCNTSRDAGYYSELNSTLRYKSTLGNGNSKFLKDEVPTTPTKQFPKGAETIITTAVLE